MAYGAAALGPLLGEDGRVQRGRIAVAVDHAGIAQAQAEAVGAEQDAAIADQTAEQRAAEAVELRLFDGLENEEIADALGGGAVV